MTIPTRPKTAEEKANAYADAVAQEIDGNRDYREVRAYRAGHAEGRSDGFSDGVEASALEAEKWFEIFNFDSFHESDVRRCANPNQIAARIRTLREGSSK